MLVASDGSTFGLVQQLQESGPLTYAAVVAAGLFALVLAVLLALAGRGRAIPAAAILFFALAPWWVAMIGLLVGGDELAGASLADPSSRATLLARTIAHALGVRIVGASIVIGSATTVGFALLIAAFGVKGPRWPALVGGAALSFAAAVSAGFVYHYTSEVTVGFGALAGASSGSRAQLIAAMAAELDFAAALSTYAPHVLVLGAGLVAAAAHAVGRRAPTVGATLLGIVAGVGVILTFGLDTFAQSRAAATIAAAAGPAWSGIADFTPTRASSRLDAEIDAFMTRDGALVDIGGGAVRTLGAAPTTDVLRTLVASAPSASDYGSARPLAIVLPPPVAGAIAPPAAGVPIPTSPRITIAVDSRAPGTALRALLRSAAEAGASTVLFAGASASPVAADDVSSLPLLAPFVSAPTAVQALLASRLPPQLAENDPTLAHTRITSATPAPLAMRAGGVARVAPMDDPRAAICYATFDPTLDAGAVLGALGVIAERDACTPVLLADDVVPGDPSRGPTAPIVAAGSTPPVVPGAEEAAPEEGLPRAVIQRVVRTHMRDMQQCYSAALARNRGIL